MHETSMFARGRALRRAGVPRANLRHGLAILLLLWSVQPVWADEAKADAKKPEAAVKADRALENEPAEWMRFSEDGQGNGKLEVGIGTYVNDAGVKVHLVGAVHVGDASYYSALEDRFDRYDAVLYEMVKPKGSGAPLKGQNSGSMIGMFQRLLKDVLELDYQLDGIDYSKENFVHADLDAETFEQLQAERGESILGLMVQQMIKEFAKGLDGKQQAQNQPGLLDILAILDSPDRAKQLKLLLGRSFGDMESQIAGFQGTVLVTERNKKALSVLKDAIRSGRKDIGVFYGAAHMPDLESRLTLMGFKRTAFEYMTAWNISDKKTPAEKPAATERAVPLPAE